MDGGFASLGPAVIDIVEDPVETGPLRAIRRPWDMPKEGAPPPMVAARLRGLPSEVDGRFGAVVGLELEEAEGAPSEARTRGMLSFSMAMDRLDRDA